MRQKRNHPRPVLTTRRRWRSERQKPSDAYIIATRRTVCKPEKRITLAMLEAADLAVFLPDYQESAGATIEWAWCKRTGKDCALYSDMKGGGIG